MAMSASVSEQQSNCRRAILNGIILAQSSCYSLKWLGKNRTVLHLVEIRKTKKKQQIELTEDKKIIIIMNSLIIVSISQ